MINRAKLVLGLAFISAGASVAGAICNHLKLRKELDKMARSMANSVDVKVPEEVVNKAINIAVDREVSNCAIKAARDASNMIASDIRKKAEVAVNNEYANIRNDVKSALTKKVGDLDISEIREEVVEKAKDEAATRFKNDLDKVLDTYSENLKNVGKIYQSIADTMNPKD